MGAKGFSYSEGEEDRQGEVQQSAYNAGMFKIQRLNNCWLNIHINWRRGDWENVCNELDIVWIELEADTTSEQQEALDKIDKNITNSIGSKSGTNIWSSLRKKWKVLLRIEKMQGLGKRYIDETEDELT